MTRTERDLYKTSQDVFPNSEIVEVDSTSNNGGTTDYYSIPEEATMIQDLIEHKDMNFSQGNIFKAIYRLGNCSHSDAVRDLNKIIWFAQREIIRITI